MMLSSMTQAKTPLPKTLAKQVAKNTVEKEQEKLYISEQDRYPLAHKLKLQMQVLQNGQSSRYVSHCSKKYSGTYMPLHDAPLIELLKSQILLLTTLQQHPCMPPTETFTVASSLLDNKQNTASAMQKSSHVMESDHVCATAVDISNQARSEFDRLWKHRIERSTNSNLNIQEKQKIAELWYTLRICSEEYSFARNGGDDYVTTDYATDTPIGKMNVTLEEQLEQDRLKNMLQDLVIRFPHRHHGDILLDEEQDAYISRVLYVAEASIGTFVVKDIIRAMKHCCELELANKTAESNSSGFAASSTVSVVSKEKWIRVLQAFKRVYCCLCTEGKDPACCIFLNKS